MEIDLKAIEEAFAERVLAQLHKQELVTDDDVAQILSQDHTGFGVWVGAPFHEEAVTADAQAIAEVHVASKKAALRGMAPDAALDRLSVAERIEKWRAGISEQQYQTLVAEDSDRIFGFINFGPTRDQDLGSEKVGEITTLYVHPDAWRRGLGRDLVVNALSRLKSAGFALVTLWTLESSSQARTFYESCGFAFDGTVKLGTLPGDVAVTAGEALNYHPHLHGKVLRVMCLSRAAGPHNYGKSRIGVS